MKTLPWILAGAAVAAAAYVLYNTPGPEYATGNDTLESAARRTAQWGSRSRIKGGSENLLGVLKEGLGQATGNPDLADSGTASRIGGTLTDAAGTLAQAAGQTLHDLNR